MIHEIHLPKLGQMMEEGTILEWLKQEGEEVQEGEVLFAMESDKATTEVEAPVDGFLRQILVSAGQTASVQELVALISDEEDEDLSGYEVRAQDFTLEGGFIRPADSVGTGVGKAEPGITEFVTRRVRASPRARRRAQEEGVDLTHLTGTGPDGSIVERDVVSYLESLPGATRVAQRLAEHEGIDLAQLEGSGRDGRITKADVEQALKKREAVPPDELAASTPTDAVTEVPMRGVRARVAQRMRKSHQITAPVTLTTETDAAALVATRESLKVELAEQLGFNIGYSDLLIKLVASALRQFPYMNAELEDLGEGEALIRHHSRVNIALAVDTDRGLLVPVVEDADRKGLKTIARNVRELVEQAREGKALPDQLRGSTFTITNLGMHEIDAFTPIINLPEAAILGVGRIKERPAVMDGELCIRHKLWLSLTFDHRLVDGAPAARFLQHIKRLIENPYLLIA